MGKEKRVHNELEIGKNIYQLIWTFMWLIFTFGITSILKSGWCVLILIFWMVGFILDKDKNETIDDEVQILPDIKYEK